MDVEAPRGLLRYFELLEDPRMQRTRLHSLYDILTITILGVICGAETWTDVELFGCSKHQWLKTFLDLPHGIPSHDTFGRVFAHLDPLCFERCFLNWTADLAQTSGGRLIAIDGKTIRRSFDQAGEKAGIHMVSAWCETNHIVLGQVATDVKSNEITAIPKLLKLLDLSDAVITIDAMGCQKDIAKQVIDQNGDYLLQLKANQPTLHEEAKLFFEDALEHQFEHMAYAYAEQVDGGHGRVETRRLWSTWDIDWFQDRRDWAGLNSFVCVESKREINGHVSIERRYYISSLDGRDADAVLEAIRGHWGIENRLHWSLDVSFREDLSRVRKGHAAENLSRIRRIALNLLKRDSTVKAGIQGKRLKCGWDHDYLLNVITQGN